MNGFLYLLVNFPSVGWVEYIQKCPPPPFHLSMGLHFWWVDANIDGLFPLSILALAKVNNCWTNLQEISRRLFFWLQYCKSEIGFCILVKRLKIVKARWPNCLAWYRSLCPLYVVYALFFLSWPSMSVIQMSMFVRNPSMFLPCEFSPCRSISVTVLKH